MNDGDIDRDQESRNRKSRRWVEISGGYYTIRITRKPNNAPEQLSSGYGRGPEPAPLLFTAFAVLRERRAAAGYAF
jgi:hypothetical protein